MKNIYKDLIIKQCANGMFYVAMKDPIALDQSVADYLNLSLKEYQNVLISNGALYQKSNQECYLSYQKDAKKMIEFLEAYLIMKKLTE